MHPLEELSGLVNPQDAQHPEARKAIVKVTLGLRKVLRSGMWPKPFQVSGASFLELAGDRALVADEQGLGKTITAICRILLKLHLPALVVAPPSTLLNWKKEFNRWAPGLKVHRLDKVAVAVPPPGWLGVVITTWDLLRYHTEGLTRLKPRILVADEAHYILNEGADRSAYFEELADNIPHLLLMTGTPQKNRPQELWRLLHIVDRRAWPEATLPSFKELNKDDFSRGVQTRLTRRVRQFMLRREKADATPELGEKVVRPLVVEIPEAKMALYRQVERRFEEWLDEKVRGEIEAEGLELEEEALEAEVLRRSRSALGSKALAQVGQLRQLIGELKAPIAARWLIEAARAGEAIVAFAHHKSVIERVSQELRQAEIPFGVIDGKTPKTRRFSLVNEFQDGKIKVVVCSGAAREGITLTRARHVFFCERFWTPAEEDQAADRVHRISQTREVTVWILKALGTIDMRMDQVVGRKRVVIGRTMKREK
jgi:SNF2 family DNA or RNA helicase